ncbi:uncharacterized protein C2845_PM01G20280 [Panicum miliaceum]|uniref:Uncharacterized protein n=1 Tax=Panicum miliaceum TaxID=4540 RepID=A0A3L6TL91_PANMI|nr:uncharacterized protein C2845_PM01G20280 [Panicum miliaceum]
MMLLPDKDGGDDNAAGRGFRVAVAQVEEGVAVGAVYSSGTGAWANHVTAPAPVSSRVLWKEKPGAVVGDTVYWLLNDDRVLSLELGAGSQQVLAVLEPAAGNVPSVYAQNAQLMTAPGGMKLGLAGVSASALRLWTWMPLRTVLLDTLLPEPRRRHDEPALVACARIVGVDEDGAVVFLRRPHKAIKSEFYSALEKDLDELLEVGDKDATACREAPIFDDYVSDSDPEAEPYLGGKGLVITSTPEGRFVYWKGMKPSELLGDDKRLVAHLDSLPFQEGRPLGEITPSGTVLVDYSSDDPSTHRHVFMAESDEYSDRHRNERPEQISENEHTADAANESAYDREARRLRNRKPAQDVGFNTPAANIAGITAVLAGNPDLQVQTAVRMAQGALLQINQQNPMPSVSRGRGEGEGESQVSRTPGGHPRRQAAPSNNQQGSSGPQGSRPATHAPHPEGFVHNYRRSALEKLPTGDLRDKINMGRDARFIINNRRKERAGAEGNTT